MRTRPLLPSVCQSPRGVSACSPDACCDAFAVGGTVSGAVWAVTTGFSTGLSTVNFSTGGRFSTGTTLDSARSGTAGGALGCAATATGGDAAGLAWTGVDAGEVADEGTGDKAGAAAGDFAVGASGAAAASSTPSSRCVPRSPGTETERQDVEKQCRGLSTRIR